MTHETIKALVHMRKVCEDKIKAELIKRGLSEDTAQTIAKLIAMEAEVETRKHFQNEEQD